MDYKSAIIDDLIKLRKDSVTTSVKDEKFYITRKNFKNEDEVVCRLKCNNEDAYKVFSLFIIEEKAEFEKNNRKHWRQLKMFDSKSGLQIAQES